MILKINKFGVNKTKKIPGVVPIFSICRLSPGNRRLDATLIVKEPLELHTLGVLLLGLKFSLDCDETCGMYLGGAGLAMPKYFALSADDRLCAVDK